MLSNAESLTSAETVPVAPVAATCPTDTDTVWCTTLTVGHSLDSSTVTRQRLGI